MVRLATAGMGAVSNDERVGTQAMKENAERDSDRHDGQDEARLFSQLIEGQEGEDHRGETSWAEPAKKCHCCCAEVRSVERETHRHHPDDREAQNRITEATQ